MKAILLFFLLPSLIFAQEIGGVSSGPLPAHDLGNSLSFSIILKPSTQSLHWKIIKSSQSEGGPDSILSGEKIRPEEKYSYYWDPKTSTLWFATPRSIMDIKLNDWSFTKALYRPTSGFNDYSDLPPPFKASIKEILK